MQQIEGIFDLINVTLILIGAFFIWRAQAPNQTQNTFRDWLMNVWLIIGQSRWMKIPEEIITQALENRVALREYVRVLRKSKSYSLVIMILTPVLLLSALLISGHEVNMLRLTIILLPCVFIVLFYTCTEMCLKVIFQPFQKLYQPKAIDKDGIRKALTLSTIVPFFFFLTLNWLLSIWFAILSVFNTILWMKIALEQNLVLSLLVAIAIAPIAWYGYYLSFQIIESKLQLIKWDEKKHEKRDAMSLLAVGASISIIWTIIALIVGSYIDSYAWQPRSIQFILSNILFDSITVFLTVTILERSIRESKSTLWKIPLAVFVVLIIAAILACLSIFFGLLFTENKLSIKEIFNIFIGESPNGNSWEFGPLFWAMHTTFIPVLIYMLLILLGWFGKLVVLLARFLMAEGKDSDNPYKYSAYFFFGLAALETGIKAIIKLTI